MKKPPSNKPLSAFNNRRVGIMALLGFGSGLPLLLTGSTLTVWMTSVGVDLELVGIFALVSLPYNFKFLWAPLMDRFGLRWLGRRRGWMMLTQMALLVAIGLMGSIEPTHAPTCLAALAVAVAFLSSSQDIVSDAYRTDVLLPGERASGAAVFVAGYRLGMIAAGAGALMLTEWIHWWAIYWLVAGMMLIGMLGTAMAPKTELLAVEAQPPRTLREAFVVPFTEFFGRKGAVSLLLIVVLYKMGESVEGHMVGPFLIRIGFSPFEIGAIAKGFGIGATILGGLIGGGLVARFGLRRSLIWFGLLQATTNLFYLALAETGKNYSLLVAAIGVDNLCGGLATAAFVGFLMSLCDRRFSATQYALFSSASSVVGRLFSAPSGIVAEAIGWSAFFGVTIALSLPAVLLIVFTKFDD